jgi:ABC transport system ATP-binding/permease protein
MVERKKPLLGGAGRSETVLWHPHREQGRITAGREKQTPFFASLAGWALICQKKPVDSPQAPNEPRVRKPKWALKDRAFKLLRAIPAIGRLRALRPGADSQVGVLVDAFAAFATSDGELSPLEADLILDLLRSAFPEVDHGWLARRLQRAARNPLPLPLLAAQLKDSYDENGKLALGLQLFTLVDAAGRSERNRASFEVFMRRLGRPDFGTAIMREMRADLPCPPEAEIPFERLIFGRDGADVMLPPAAAEHEFRVYRSGDLVLVRNTGQAPLWLRGRSVETGAFLRMRERQPLVVPGWNLRFEDLVFFLDVKRTGNTPAIYLHSGPAGLTAERTLGRQSSVRVRFGLKAEVEALHDTQLHAGSHGPLKKGTIITCLNHERLGDESGFSLSINELRRKAIQSGRRFRLAADRQEYRVSNDAASLSRGDLLLGPKLSPRTVLFIRYDSQKAEGELKILESNGPILVDGVSVRQTAVLNDGSLIRLSGSQSVRCRFSEGFIDEERTLIESLRVEDMVHDFAPGARALDHINFEIKRGEMLCIIGPSGSGKSTLLAALSGQRQPTRGMVKLNGISLYDRREHLVPFIAHMPQEEALNPQLTVREHLRHAVTIRRPALSLAEHERRVDSMLAELGLQTIARRTVGSPGDKTISGGERSRLNLGLDLGSRAEVFLFDEPISGLSSKDSEHVAETLRSLAREKIVIASLHRPGAPVLRLFDKVLLLDSGGRLAYFGSTAGMIGYFREACDELGIIHPSVTAKSPLGADFVFDVLETPINTIGGGSNTGAARRFPPTFWQERFESADLMNSLEAGGGPISRLGDPRTDERLPLPPRPTRRLHAVIAVFATHFLRSFLSKARNRGTIYSTFLEAPVLAALVGNTLRSSASGPYEFGTALHLPAYLFLSATVAMFLGLTNTATEILRDRPVFRRERNCQPGAASYVLAKFTALAILAALQCLIYLVVGNHFLEIHGMLLYHWIWMTLTALTGTALALVISSLVKTERAALTAVPLLLVPQMLLAGALVPYREMNRGLFENASEVRERGGVPVPAVVMPLRYAYEGMVVCQAVRNPFEIERIRLQRRVDRARNLEKPMTPKERESFESAKEGLRRLLAAGASSTGQAAELISRIRRISTDGNRMELETLKLWPDDDPKAKPASAFFVNERIDLIVREAESFRNDFRNTNYRSVFHALKKPRPWAGSKPQNPTRDEEENAQIETQKYCGIVLALIIAACIALTTVVLSRQNRMTR